MFNFFWIPIPGPSRHSLMGKILHYVMQSLDINLEAAHFLFPDKHQHPSKEIVNTGDFGWKVFLLWARITLEVHCALVNIAVAHIWGYLLGGFGYNTSNKWDVLTNTTLFWDFSRPEPPSNPRCCELPELCIAPVRISPQGNMSAFLRLTSLIQKNHSMMVVFSGICTVVFCCLKTRVLDSEKCHLHFWPTPRKGGSDQNDKIEQTSCQVIFVNFFGLRSWEGRWRL